jgi:hypothetical protein
MEIHGFYYGIFIKYLSKLYKKDIHSHLLLNISKTTSPVEVFFGVRTLRHQGHAYNFQLTFISPNITFFFAYGKKTFLHI